MEIPFASHLYWFFGQFEIFLWLTIAYWFFCVGMSLEVIRFFLEFFSCHQKQWCNLLEIQPICLLQDCQHQMAQNLKDLHHCFYDIKKILEKI